MKKLILSLSMLIVGTTLFAQSSTRVSGYTNSYGTYVESYYRTSPNSTVYDNYSTKGNINLYTGSYGTKSPDVYLPSSSFSFPSSNYSSGYTSSTIFTGPRGGTYYYNSNGNKAYIKK